MAHFVYQLGREDGHGVPLIGALAAAVGAILLAIGAATGGDAMAIAGGIMLAVGILAMPVLAHLTIDYDIYGRLEALENRATEHTEE